MMDLQCDVKIKVRFNEVDALNVVWHGHYSSYFEQGRGEFGDCFDLGYLDIYEAGYTVPIVHFQCNFKRPLTFGDEVVIRTIFISSPAAKIIFNYELKNALTGDLVATGDTTQVFLNQKNELDLNNPEFFIRWKQKWNQL